MPVFDKPNKSKCGDVRQNSRIQLWKSECMTTDLIAAGRVTCNVSMGINVRIACVISDHLVAMPVVTIGGHRKCFASRNDRRPKHDGRNGHGYEAVHSHAENVCQNMAIGNAGGIAGLQRLIVHHKNRLRKCEPHTPFGLLRVTLLSK